MHFSQCIREGRESDLGVKEVGCVQGSGRISSHIDLAAAYPVSYLSVLPQRAPVQNGRYCFHIPMKSKIAHKAELVQGYVTACC